MLPPPRSERGQLLPKFSAFHAALWSGGQFLPEFTSLGNQGAASSAVSPTSFQRLTHAQRTCIETDGGPFEAERFSKSQAECGRNRDERAEAMLLHRIEQRARLFWREGLNLFCLMTRRLDKCRNVLMHHLPLPRLVQRGAQDSAGVPNIARSGPSAVMLPKPRLDLHWCEARQRDPSQARREM